MTEELTSQLAREHRDIEERFGQFLAAAFAGDAAAAREAIDAFDDALRRHTALEEERLYPDAPAHHLAIPMQETERRGCSASCGSSTCRFASCPA